MIYGKAACTIESEHGQLHLTVTGQVTSLKQGNDLIRLTLDEARELAQDLAAAIEELERSPLRQLTSLLIFKRAARDRNHGNEAFPCHLVRDVRRCIGRQISESVVAINIA
jgi:hypothetical protein